MSRHSLGSFLRGTVGLSAETVDMLVPKLTAKQVCEVRHLKALRDAEGLEDLFEDRLMEMYTVSAALDHAFPPPGPASAAVGQSELLEPLQPAEAVAAAATAMVAARVAVASATTTDRQPPAPPDVTAAASMAHVVGDDAPATCELPLATSTTQLEQASATLPPPPASEEPAAPMLSVAVDAPALPPSTPHE